jgi:hypothetical protein
MMAGGVLLSAGGAWAQAGGGAAEDCFSLGSSIMYLSSQSWRAAEATREVEDQAKKAQRQADRIRTMSPKSRSETITLLEGSLKALQERQARDGGLDSDDEQRLRQLRVTINALKDAELRANDLELTGGFVTSDRNAMDAYARELEGKIASAKDQERRAVQSLKDAERAYADCLARKERQEASLLRERELLASAAAAGDNYDSYDEGGYGDGYDGVASDAYPPRPSLRPPRVRPARPDRWTASAGYDGPRDMQAGRKARGGWDYGNQARSGERRARAGGRRGEGFRADARGGRDERRGAKGQGGGKRGKGGKGQSNCHTNPITGQQHCGSG